MLLESKNLLERYNVELQQLRERWKTTPGIALIWVGSDPQTAAFVRVKQRKAKELQCNFSLHHFPTISDRQLEAVIASLNSRKDVHGIVLQLPLPKNVSTDKAISLLSPEKDVDGLRRDSSFSAPTATGIIELLKHNNIDLAAKKTAILGDGWLVGHPLATEFAKRKWPYVQFSQKAEQHIDEIHNCDVLLSSTGQENLVQPAMVHTKMIVVDGSGVDVDLKVIEPLVKIVTPKRGAIGPLTVNILFNNLLTSSLPAS